MTDFAKLYTKYSENNKTPFFNAYPRPRLKRDSFLNLNGEWNFAANNGSEPQEYDLKINVPYCPESLLSGINKVFSEDKTFWYSRNFTLPKGFLRDRVILHFGAVDSVCEVFINGKSIGEHIGGYDAFSFDITDCLLSENVVTVRVTDNLSSGILPYGKQKRNRGGMWYTPVTGIWQTVWIESVADKHIKSIKVDTTLNSAKLQFSGIENGEVLLQNKGYKIENGVCEISIDNPQYWSPESPYLYYFTAVSGEDRVESYFALRQLEVATVNGTKRLLLNGKPYFFHGILDQGYWSDGIFTPADPCAYADDILMLKSLGFNMLRKHIKIEPELFYFECDRQGIAVFQDMVNNSDYSFLRDTALPTLGILSMNDKRLHKNKESRAAFIKGMEKTVEALYSYPCVCQWTIFNEGWGQFCADEMYERLKKLDSSRFIDSASGWFRAEKNDFESRHIYFRKLKAVKTEKPYFISEFGGYAYAEKGYIFNAKKAFGYAICKSREDFVNRLCALYKNEVIPLVKKGLCATVYTQVSDVEDEINGLVTYDRRVQKITPEEFYEISEELKNSI